MEQSGMDQKLVSQMRKLNDENWDKPVQFITRIMCLRVSKCHILRNKYISQHNCIYGSGQHTCMHIDEMTVSYTSLLTFSFHCLGENQDKIQLSSHSWWSLMTRCKRGHINQRIRLEQKRGCLCVHFTYILSDTGWLIVGSEIRLNWIRRILHEE